MKAAFRYFRSSKSYRQKFVNSHDCRRFCTKVNMLALLSTDIGKLSRHLCDFLLIQSDLSEHACGYIFILRIYKLRFSRLTRLRDRDAQSQLSRVFIALRKFGIEAHIFVSCRHTWPIDSSRDLIVKPKRYPNGGVDEIKSFNLKRLEFHVLFLTLH